MALRNMAKVISETVRNKSTVNARVFVRNRLRPIRITTEPIPPAPGSFYYGIHVSPITNLKTLYFDASATETTPFAIKQDPAVPMTTYPWTPMMDTIQDIIFESPIRPYHLTNFLQLSNRRTGNWENKILQLDIMCDAAVDAENAINIPEVAGQYIKKLVWNDCDWKALQTIPTNLINARWAIRDFEHYDWKVYNNNFFTNCLGWLAYSPVQTPGKWDHPQIIDTRTIQLQPDSVITQYTTLNYGSGQRVTAPAWLILNKDICDHTYDIRNFCSNYGIDAPGTCDVQHIYLEGETLIGRDASDMEVAYYDQWGQSIVSCWCGPWLVRNPNDPSWDQWRWPWFCYPRDTMNSHNVRGYVWTQYANRYCYTKSRDAYWDLPTWGSVWFHLFEDIPEELKDYYKRPKERS